MAARRCLLSDREATDHTVGLLRCLTKGATRAPHSCDDGDEATALVGPCQGSEGQSAPAMDCIDIHISVQLSVQRATVASSCSGGNRIKPRVTTDRMIGTAYSAMVRQRHTVRWCAIGGVNTKRRHPKRERV